MRATAQFKDLSLPSRALYREIVKAVPSDPLFVWLGFSATELRYFTFWAPASNDLINLKFSLTWHLIKNGLSLNDVRFRLGWADKPDCHRCDLGLEETSAHTFYQYLQVHPFWNPVELTVRFDPKHLVSIDLASACDNVFSPGSNYAGGGMFFRKVFSNNPVYLLK